MRGSAWWKMLLSLGTICTLMISIDHAAIASMDQPTSNNSNTVSTSFDLKKLNHQRKAIFDQTSLVTGIPWNLIAAVDQYEFTIHQFKKRKKSKEPQGLISIQFPERMWTGMLNPDPDDKEMQSIRMFKGIGIDGSGDGYADEQDPMDRLAAMTSIMLKRGKKLEDIRISLWNHYQNTRSVQRIEQFAAIYAAKGTLDLYERAFPLPIKATYSYTDTYGASRGWGGHRIHEGTDLFAGYGTPVRSTCYGIVEVKGWNPYGGWRIGIRDIGNVYHYFAHLQSYKKELKVGDIVVPGQVIGAVGSSGYGKPGTSGKFVPHLHYGMYRDGGLADWSFDPYHYLKRWERDDFKAKAK